MQKLKSSEQNWYSKNKIKNVRNVLVMKKYNYISYMFPPRLWLLHVLPDRTSVKSKNNCAQNA